MIGYIKHHLAFKISLLLLPLLLVGIGGLAWFFIDHQVRYVEEENFNKARSAAIVGAQAMEHFLEELAISGVFTTEQVFDRNYRLIERGHLAGTKIPKYHTEYDSYIDPRIRHLEDAFLADPNIVYAVLVDANGYLPTHNSRYSQPLVGDDDKDRVGNRTKRIFNDPVGLKAARFEGGAGKPVLRQVYHRDTGVTMWDVTAPVSVFGRHWGGFRIGLSMEKTEAEIARLVRRITTTAVILGLLTLVCMVMLIRRATGPLKRLTEQTHAIAEGKRQEPITLHSQDEIGELVRSFNQMKQALENTTVSRDFFDRIVNSIHDLLLVTDPQGSLVRINQSVGETLGQTVDELLSRNIATLFTDKTGGIIWHEHLLKEKRLEAADVFLPDSKGEERALSMSASPLYTETGQVDGFIIVCQDNSRRIRAEIEMEKAFDQAFALNAELREASESVEKQHAELEEAYQKLKTSQSQILQQEKMASIGQLAAGVAHEINNPMGFITSNLQTLSKYLDRLNIYIDAQKELLLEKVNKAELEPLKAQRKKLKIDYLIEDGRDLLDESLDGASRVKEIVQNLKSFSRVDQAEIAEVNLNTCLESTISIAWNELKYKTTLEKELGELDPLRCHPQQLNQVFLNMLVNAAQAIDKQGTIQVKTWQDEENQYVSIRDDGSGIPAEIQQKIFEPFFTTKEVGKGTGLGMSISFEIIENHGGRIDLKSEVGVGTSFTIVLPRVGISAEAEDEA